MRRNRPGAPIRTSRARAEHPSLPAAFWFFSVVLSRTHTHTLPLPSVSTVCSGRLPFLCLQGQKTQLITHTDTLTHTLSVRQRVSTDGICVYGNDLVQRKRSLNKVEILSSTQTHVYIWMPAWLCVNALVMKMSTDAVTVGRSTTGLQNSRPHLNWKNVSVLSRRPNYSWVTGVPPQITFEWQRPTHVLVSDQSCRSSVRSVRVKAVQKKRLDP